MYYKDFLELNLPIGTKIRYKENKWLYIGLGIYDKRVVIKLAKNNSESSGCSTANIFQWNDDEEIEVIEYPVKYMSIAKYHEGDIVYLNEEKLMILEERDENGYYLTFNYSAVHQAVEHKHETELSLEPKEKINEMVGIK